MYWWDSIGQCNENVHGTGNMSIISLDWTLIDSRRNSRRNTATIREKNVKHTLHLKRSERERKRLETFACLFFLFFSSSPSSWSPVKTKKCSPCPEDEGKSTIFLACFLCWTSHTRVQTGVLERKNKTRALIESVLVVEENNPMPVIVFPLLQPCRADQNKPQALYQGQ